MKPTNSPTPDLALLPKIFQNYPDILAVYLFGSAATDRIHLESDLDLAIVPRHPDLQQKKLALQTDLVRHGFDKVDLVILSPDNIVLQFEAVHQNRLIYQAEDFEHSSYFSKIVRQYIDFEPYLRVQRQAQKRRILDG
jgi:predicted nucleotidyltransferase